MENGLPGSRKCLRRGTMTTLGDKSADRISWMTTPEKQSAHRRSSIQYPFLPHINFSRRVS